MQRILAATTRVVNTQLTGTTIHEGGAAIHSLNGLYVNGQIGGTTVLARINAPGL